MIRQNQSAVACAVHTASVPGVAIGLSAEHSGHYSIFLRSCRGSCQLPLQNSCIFHS